MRHHEATILEKASVRPVIVAVSLVLQARWNTAEARLVPSSAALVVVEDQPFAVTTLTHPPALVAVGGIPTLKLVHNLSTTYRVSAVQALSASGHLG